METWRWYMCVSDITVHVSDNALKITEEIQPELCRLLTVLWCKSIRNEREIADQWTLARWLNTYGIRIVVFFAFPQFQNIATEIIECSESCNVRFTRNVVESTNTNANMNANNMHIIVLFDKFIQFSREISREHKFAPRNVSWLFRSGRQETAIYHRSWKPTAFASSIKFVRGFHLRIIFHFRLQKHKIDKQTWKWYNSTRNSHVRTSKVYKLIRNDNCSVSECRSNNYNSKWE